MDDKNNRPFRHELDSSRPDSNAPEQRNRQHIDRATTDQPAVEPILLDVKGVASLLGLGKNTVIRHNDTGQLGPMSIKLGRRRLWRKDEILQWVEADCPPRKRWQSMRRQGSRRATAI